MAVPTSAFAAKSGLVTIIHYHLAHSRVVMPPAARLSSPDLSSLRS